MARAPLGFLVRGHGARTIESNPWLPVADLERSDESNETESTVLGSNISNLVVQYDREFPVSGVYGVAPGVTTLGGIGEAQQVVPVLCRGRREFLEIQPAKAPPAIEENSELFRLSFLSNDLSSAVYLSKDRSFPHLLANLQATPPSVTAEMEYFDFEPSSVNVEAGNMIEARDGVPAVWVLGDADSFMQGSREIDVQPYAEDTFYSALDWAKANETTSMNLLMAGRSVQVIVQCRFISSDDENIMTASTRVFGLDPASAALLWEVHPDKLVVTGKVYHSLKCPRVQFTNDRNILQMSATLIDRRAELIGYPGLSGPRLLRIDAATGRVLSDLVLARDTASTTDPTTLHVPSAAW